MRFRLFRVLRLVGLLLLPLLIFTSVAAADPTVSTAPHLAFPTQQVVTLAVGALVPLITYALNHFAPWASEQVKAVILVVVSAAAGAIYTAAATSSFGWNNSTLEMVLTAVAGSLAAHNWLWRPSGINLALGGGSNAQRRHLRISFTGNNPPPPPPPQAQGQPPAAA